MGNSSGILASTVGNNDMENQYVICIGRRWVHLKGVDSMQPLEGYIDAQYYYQMCYPRYGLLLYDASYIAKSKISLSYT